MKKAMWTLPLVVLVALLPAQDTWSVDRDHSFIRFTVRHMVVSRVSGTFNDWQAELSGNESEPLRSRIRVVVKAASIDTANEKRDAHLRSADFFDAGNHPDIVFESGGIEQTGAGYLLRGKLTLRGVTRDIAVPFSVSEKIVDPWGRERVGFETAFEIDRKEFGVSWSKVMDNGGLVVGNTVKVEVALEAVKN